MKQVHSDNLVKIGIRDEDGQMETFWGFCVGDNLYRLDNSPFCVYRVSYEDVVEAIAAADGFLEFTRVIQKSNNRTIRARLAKPCDVAPGPALLKDIKRLGCTYEGAYEKLFSINVPPAVKLQAVAEMLNELGVEWEYADPKYEDLFPDKSVS